MSDSFDAPSEPAPADALLTVWLEQTHDLVVLTDDHGRIQWSNPAFVRAVAASGPSPVELIELAPASTRRAARERLAAALRGEPLSESELHLRTTGGADLWVTARVSRVGHQWLWTLADVTQREQLAARARHLNELLDTAQEFGRLGVWEREIPSGKGRWDRHVFGFWGLQPATETPDFEEAVRRIHPADQGLASTYLESTRQAGRYVDRYRVIQPDGSLRWIQSQWEIKNGPDGRPNRAIGIMVDDTKVYDDARALHSASEQLKLAIDMANIIVWRYDLKADMLHYNDRGYTLLGLPPRPEGLAREEVAALLHPDDRSKSRGAARQAIATGLPVDVETRYVRADGSFSYVLTRRVVDRDASGDRLGFVGVSLDVTDQVGQARRAEQLAQRLEAAAEAARIGVWTTMVDSTDTEWNAQMYELFDTVDRARPPTLSEWLTQCIHPSDLARVAQGAKDYLRLGTGAFEAEFRTLRRDGSTRWMVLRADMDRSSTDGRRIFGIVMDVTEHRESLAALHAASERAGLIARSAGIGTWQVDGDGGPAIWDDQMFTLRGMPPRAVALDHHERMALVHPDDLETVLDHAQNKLRSDTPAAYEFRVRWPDGTYRWLASRSAVIRDANGVAIRRVGVNWDVTETKNAELVRQQAVLAARESRAKSQFLSRMSHELRTPLNAVLGFTQLLQLEARDKGSASQLGKLGHIRAAGEHLLTLINDVLDLSSLEAGTLKLDLQPVAMAVAVRDALHLMADLADRHGVVLQPGPLAGTARADVTRLRQVMLNLLSNAIKFNRPGGKVVIESRLESGWVRLTVRDTGRGMRPDQLAHLFEPFNRLGVDTERIEGSGIGLTIAKALTESMGGAIRATSEPGEGTVFEIDLPARTAPAEAESVATASALADATVAERRGQLLYIEDNPVNVLLVEELVRSLSGLAIASESTGTSGVARARSLRPDVILIDMQLPDFDGFEVLRQLRLLPETAAIPCIALSANAMQEDIERALGAGFDDYWTKPIKFKEFLLALEGLFPLR